MLDGEVCLVGLLLVFGAHGGACAFIIQPVVGGYASYLGLVVVLSLYGRIVLVFLYLKAFCTSKLFVLRVLEIC